MLPRNYRVVGAALVLLSFGTALEARAGWGALKPWRWFRHAQELPKGPPVQDPVTGDRDVVDRPGDEPEFFDPKDKPELMDPNVVPPPPAKPPSKDAELGGFWAQLEGRPGEFGSRTMKDAIADVTRSSGSAVWTAPLRLEIVGPRGPIQHAWVIVNGKETKLNLDKNGVAEFPAPPGGTPFMLKIPGYKRVVFGPWTTTQAQIRVGENKPLEPLVARVLYVASVKNATVMNAILKHVEQQRANALVIDFKGDLGEKRKNNIGDEFQALKARGLYLIARVVAFKDNAAARKKPSMALKRQDNGESWIDKGGSAFLDPANEEARAYIIDFAKEAAAAGFDEIEFDYVRYPSDAAPGNPRDNIAGFARKPGETPAQYAARRGENIAGFLRTARSALEPYGVFLAADLFGIAGNEENDLTRIGQKPEVVTGVLDYVCPMVYPSGYASGTDFQTIEKGKREVRRFPNPDGEPGPLVEYATLKFAERSFPGAVVRPWLQYFHPYTGRAPGKYFEKEIADQVVAIDRLSKRVDDRNATGANQARVEGWLMWNAASRFDRGGF